MPRKSPDDTNTENLGLHHRLCSGPDCIQRGKYGKLKQCGACKAVLCCGPAHQKAHRKVHKTSCNLIKESREKLDQEDAKLRARPDRPLETKAGVFIYGVNDTRPYMQARHDLISAILNVRNGGAVQVALDNALESLRLCRGDNLRSSKSGAAFVYTIGAGLGRVRFCQMVRYCRRAKQLRLG